jgi:ketosteroid isomerase-like protein
VSDADIETVRRSYEALNEGDVEAALEALDPDAVWRDSPELPGGGEFRGREEVSRFLGEFLAEWRDFHQRIDEAIREGDRVAVVIHLSATGRASGIEVDTSYAHLWTMHDGIGVRVDAYRDPDEALRELRGTA